jgi:hypothetical protein
MACAMESVVLNLPQTLGMEFRWKTKSMLEKSKSSMPNMAKKDLKVVQSLRLNKGVRILQTDKGNCTVFSESKYKDS